MESDSLEGTTLGEYQVVRLLGHGGMGEVYEGLQPVIGKRVAIKVLTGAAAASPENAERFLREARAVNSIGHRGIVDIFSFGQLPDGRGYFVMPLLQGEPLNEYLKVHAPLPSADVVTFLDQLLEALGAAHEKGIVHRDLKPSNVFVARQQNGSRYLMLLDFGIAKLTGDSNLTHANAVLGTPHFMSPEQARGTATASSDLYAVGCIAWTMLTKRYPFNGANPIELINSHLNTPPPSPKLFNPTVPLGLESLVLKLMAKRPEERPASAAAVREELKRLRKEVPALAGTSVQPSHVPAATRTEPELPVGSERPADEPSLVTETIERPAVSAGPATETIERQLSRPMPNTETIERPAITPISVAPRTESDTVERTSARRSGWPFFVLGGVLLAAIGLAVGLRPPPAVEKPTPSPPAVVVAPAPSPAPLTSEVLAARIAALAAALEKRKPGGDRVAAMLLDDARDQLKGAKDPAALAAVGQFLDGWEQRFVNP